jgi:hypothetical protein
MSKSSLTKTRRRVPVTGHEQKENAKWNEPQYLEADVKSWSNDSEIERRAATVKNRLIADALDAGGSPLTVNGIVSYISVLLQVPNIVLLYKKESKTAKHLRYLPYFSIKNVFASREQTEIYNFAGTLYQKALYKKITSTIPENEGFRLFDTDICIKCYILYITKENTSKFYELNKNFENSKIKDPKFKENIGRQKYALNLLERFIKFSNDDAIFYSKDFLSEINSQIEKPFKNLYFQSANDKKRLISIADVDMTSLVSKKIEQRFNEMRGENHGLDRIYSRAGFASGRLNFLTNKFENDVSSNILFSFRSFDRSAVRYENNEFSGFEYNVRFIIPHTQRNKIQDYFSLLKKGGKIKYSKSKSGQELYAADWDFENANLKKLAIQLDQLFWNEISDKNNILFADLLKVLDAPIGDGSASFFDIVFSQGTPVYRMPFRREGGLNRIREAAHLWVSLENLNLQKDWGYNDVVTRLAAGWEKAAFQDCMRVVIFFYLSRMLGPAITNDSEYWTRITAYPIEVHGSVVGAIGMISYQSKNEIFSSGDVLVSSAAWNQEYLFFTEVVAAAQRTVRQQFRDYQNKELVHELRRCYYEAQAKSDEQGNLSKDGVDKYLLEPMNHMADVIARICPYPPYVFKTTEAGNPIHHNINPGTHNLNQDEQQTKNSYNKFIDLENIRINPEKNEQGNYFFNQFSRQDLKGVTDENRTSLITQAQAMISAIDYSNDFYNDIAK